MTIPGVARLLHDERLLLSDHLAGAVKGLHKYTKLRGKVAPAGTCGHSCTLLFTGALSQIGA